MGANTAIEWADDSWNPWIGCQRVSPGCQHCYAETWDGRFRNGRNWGPHGVRERTSDAYWSKPLAWNEQARAAGKRRRVFPSLCDPFEDRPELVPLRAEFFALIERTPHLDWLLLTKRPENMVRLAPETWRGGWPPNVWAGTSVEDQRRADERIPHLIEVPAAVRFLSCEPLLGPVSLHSWIGNPPACGPGSERAWLPGEAGIDWVIVGGESGPGARPCCVDWIRSIKHQCQAVEVAVFVKQLGACPYEERRAQGGAQGTEAALRSLGAPHPQRSWYGGERCLTHTPDGRSRWIRPLRLNDPRGGDPAEWPEDLRVREFPAADR